MANEPRRKHSSALHTSGKWTPGETIFFRQRVGHLRTVYTSSRRKDTCSRQRGLYSRAVTLVAIWQKDRAVNAQKQCTSDKKRATSLNNAIVITRNLNILVLNGISTELQTTTSVFLYYKFAFKYLFIKEEAHNLTTIFSHSPSCLWIHNFSHSVSCSRLKPLLTHFILGDNVLVSSIKHSDLFPHKPWQ